MLTDDNEETAKIIVEKIGITKVISNVLPAQKNQVIKELKEKNKYVMMCGDGINDRLALMAANIGVSVNTGTDIAMGVFTNFGISINPMIASLAMFFSSITVILNALRLKRIKIMRQTLYNNLKS